MTHRNWRRALRALLISTAALTATATVTIAAVFIHSGWYGLNFFKRGAWVWIATAPTDTRLSEPIRLALQNEPPIATPGTLAWEKRADGFETAELPALVKGKEVDRILLARLDPEKYRFQVHNRPAGDRRLGDWMQLLHATLVVNGSYFGRRGMPATPLVSRGFASGPHEYRATHGAFVVSDDMAGLRDLGHESWKDLFKTARYGLVSYPLLVGPGRHGVKSSPHWLANRTFIGQDSEGFIILGTTKEAFFSLERLALFLKEAPLDLVLALNLDGGPVACQGIALERFKRDFCGQWEVNDDGGKLRVLRPLIGGRRVGLPIVLAALPR
jgi:hypothetical protein